ncbi:PspA/IM30 family protein [Sedimenticola sp.]|uniref:PspA/IM30 family protein n=1 Tax=Sedimenticola sp. TaxID=1940285 RepID=UPI003D0E9B3E
MALINRIARLFRADMHAVLDRMEEPDLLLKQAIREMEAAFAGDEQRHRLLQHERMRLTAQLDDGQHKLSEMEEQLDICFQSNNEALAKQLIRKKLTLARHIQQQESRAKSVQQQLTDLSQRLTENRTQLESMQQKVELLENTADDHCEHTLAEPPGNPVEEADVEVAFLREKQKRSLS